MPRLPTKRYMDRHRWLRRIWLDHRILLAVLSPTEQRQLFDYYSPHHPMADAELRAHRRSAAVGRPSLPHQAGKTLKRFRRELDELSALNTVQRGEPQGPPRQPYTRDRPIVVMSVLRPERDLTKVVIAMVQHQISQQTASSDGNPADGSPPRDV